MQEKKVTKVEVKPKQTTKKQPVKKTKVAAYARVSTVKDAQEHSLKSQRTYYTKYIKSHDDWIFAGIYTDNGISGLSMRNRDGFNRLIADAMEGKIDLILTKSLSRFARNTVDSLTTIRKLKAVGVAIYFEKENINTLDTNGEFLITLMSSFAEEESRSISENITWSVRRRFAQGIYHLFNNYGYKHPKGKDAYIVEDEAKVVRFIYMLALMGKSGHHIAEILNGYGIPSPLNATWQRGVVIQMLTNPQYMDDAILQRTYTVDFLTKKVKINEGEVPQYYVENGHPAIVSKKAWNYVQSLILDNEYTNDTSPPLARKIICGDCHGAYGPKLWHSNSKYRRIVWQCNDKFKKESKCTTPHLYEDAIKRLFVSAVGKLTAEREILLDTCQTIIDEFADTKAIDKQLQALLDEMSDTEVLIKKLIESNSGHKAVENYNERYDAYCERYNATKQKFEETQHLKITRSFQVDIIECFMFEIKNLPNLPITYSDRLWMALIDKVIVMPNETLIFVFKNGQKIIEEL